MTDDLAAKLARAIFGTAGGPCVNRIQFMGGTYPDKEFPWGGLSEDALAAFIRQELAKHLPPVPPPPTPLHDDQLAESWYSVDQVFAAIEKGEGIWGWGNFPPGPRGFAEWLAVHLRLAMKKGMQLARQGVLPPKEDSSDPRIEHLAGCVASLERRLAATFERLDKLEAQPPEAEQIGPAPLPPLPAGTEAKIRNVGNLTFSPPTPIGGVERKVAAILDRLTKLEGQPALPEWMRDLKPGDERMLRRGCVATLESEDDHPIFPLNWASRDGEHFGTTRCGRIVSSAVNASSDIVGFAPKV